MSSPSLSDRFASTAPPWIHLLVEADDLPVTLPAPPPGFVVRTLDGRRCRTKRALLDELSHVLGFPAHFGRTWDALEDCITDLAWLPGSGYVLVVTRAEQLLGRQPEDYRMLIDLLDSVGRAWATRETGHPDRAAVPFHSVLVVSECGFSKRPDWRLPRAEP